MRKIKGSAALFAVAAAGAAVLMATPASAHGAPFTVTAGSALAGTNVPVTLTSGTSNWKDTTTGVLITCSSIVLKGSVVAGSSNGRVGTIDSPTASFLNCTGPGGWKYRVTGVGTWTLDVTDSTSGASMVTVGNVRARLSSLGGPNCNWDFAGPTGSFTSTSTATTDPGSLATSYTNSSTALALPATNPGRWGCGMCGPGPATT